MTSFCGSVTSECSTTSTVYGTTPPLPERGYLRPVSDPIYDVPSQARALRIPSDSHSPGASDGSQSPPHGSPLAASPGRSPALMRHVSTHTRTLIALHVLVQYCTCMYMYIHVHAVFIHAKSVACC